MTTRELPREEWHRLTDTELGPLVAANTSSVLSIIAVEDEAGAIIGCWSLVALVHAEGIWIAPSHRKTGGVARRLLGAMWRKMRALNLAAVTTGAASSDVETLLGKLGARRLDYVPYIWPCR